MAVYILLAVLSVYFMARSLSEYSFGIVEIGFMDVALPLTLFAAVAIGIHATAIFVTFKLFSEPISLKAVIHGIGEFYEVPVALTAVSLVLLLFKSYTVGFGILAIGAGLAFATIPMFVMISQLVRQSKTIDKFYAFLFYAVFLFVAGALISVLAMDSQLGELMNTLNML
ncbi:hypothetical protein [Sporosarcina trichiuri]|uniref:hypothetical protein n=1 Tax=Sporosarcina trichiuri TaxID=3056445 RepID=UPI0025B48E1F|nr:hypothetical protein [Sporosarcina sp. 0.2-SM1T-5]WJY26361.1 hypothetical protein QWT68_09720 [Sporosarcina sp. 0.2-SM1T-5]